MLVTTVRDCTDAVAATLMVLMRKRLPSAVTAYSNWTEVFAKFCDGVTETPDTIRVSNKATGTADSKDGFAPGDDFSNRYRHHLPVVCLIVELLAVALPAWRLAACDRDRPFIVAGRELPYVNFSMPGPIRGKSHPMPIGRELAEELVELGLQE